MPTAPAQEAAVEPKWISRKRISKAYRRPGPLGPPPKSRMRMTCTPRNEWVKRMREDGEEEEDGEEREEQKIQQPTRKF